MNLLTETTAADTTAYTRLADSPFAPADIASTSGSAHDPNLQDAWNRVIDQLTSIRFLEEDWDGEGSSAPDPGAVAGATKLALALKGERYIPADRVTASVNGTIVLEWHAPEGYQEIEVTSLKDAELRWVAKGSRVTEPAAITII